MLYLVDSDGIEYTFQKIANDGDGDCLFHVILGFLQDNDFPNAPSSLVDLRREIVEYVVGGDDFLWFTRWRTEILYQFPNIVLPMTHESVSSEDENEGKTKYSVHMSQPGVYGTNTELFAAAEKYGFNGNLFVQKRPNRRVVFFRQDIPCTRLRPRACINMIFSGSVLGGHFEFLETIDGDQFGVSVLLTPHQFFSRPRNEREAAVISQVRGKTTEKRKRDNAVAVPAIRSLRRRVERVVEDFQEPTLPEKGMFNEKGECDQCKEEHDNLHDHVKNEHGRDLCPNCKRSFKRIKAHKCTTKTQNKKKSKKN